jgi:hypothetical protein
MDDAGAALPTHSNLQYIETKQRFAPSGHQRKNGPKPILVPPRCPFEGQKRGKSVYAGKCRIRHKPLFYKDKWILVKLRKIGGKQLITEQPECRMRRT